ncbi:MAG: BNR-repeat neuraminidase N-terminal domain-containing protein, partial [Bacteroidales bacterium]
MKNIHFFAFILLFAGIQAFSIQGFAQNMSYSSSRTTQKNLKSVPAGTNDAEVIGIEVVTDGSSSPLSLSGLEISSSGTTLLSDISNVKVYYTGNSEDFSSVNQFGSTVANPTSSFNITGNQQLSSDTNYFWVTYDVDANAAPANFIDASCTEIVIGSNTYTPTITDPFGSRQISKEITFGTGTSASYDNGPTYIRDYWYNVYHYQYNIFNYLITNNEISSNIPNGARVTNLSFYKNTPSRITANGQASFKVYMMSSSKTSLSNSNWSALTQLAEKVHESSWSTDNNLPSDTGWVDFPFDNKFTYNGQGIEVLTDYDGSGLPTTGSYDGQIDWAYSTTSAIQAAGRANLSTPVTSTSTYYGNTSRPNMKLEYVIPPAYDIAVNDLASPSVTQCPQTSETVSVNIKNEGGAPIDFSSKPVTVDMYVSSTTTDTFPSQTINSGILNPGDVQTVTFTNNYNMSQVGTYLFTANVSMANDNNSSNNKKTFQITVESFPAGGEDFESFTVNATSNFPNSWTSDNQSFPWTVSQGSTSSTNTGPNADHTLGNSAGKYIYTEASGYSANAVSSLTSGCIDMSAQTNKILEFWYHMYGTNIGSLHLDIYSNGSWQNDVVSLIGEQHFSYTDPWKRATVDLSSYSGLIQLRFRAIRGGGFRSDIALDDISFVPMKVDAGPDMASCGGDSVKLSPTITGGAPPLNYFWSPSSGLSDNQVLEPMASPNTTTQYTFYAVDDNGYNSSDTVTVTVYPSPSVSFTGLNTDYCENDGSSGLSPSPSGGFFTGPGTIGYAFDPAQAGTGTHQITYNYIDGNGCTGTDSQTTEVHPIPDITISGVNSNYCLDDTPVTVNTSPSGGNLSGPGISGNTFDPMQAGAGTHTITYTYTDTFGCSNTESITITVHDIPNVSISNLPGDACINDAQISLTGSPAGGNFTGPGISGSSFDPAAAGTGTHSITYSYTNAYGCANSITQDIHIHDIPTVSFSGLPDTVCGNDPAITLSGSPSGGSFSGAGISGNSFDPATAGAGTHTVTYTYNDTYGCSNDTSQTVEVLPVPTVNFSGLANMYCITDIAVSLNGSPAGGTFTGPGINGNQFDPATAGAGTHSITYSYTDASGCSNTDTQTTQVEDLPIVTIGAVNTDQCIDAAPLTLNGSPAGGTFSGNGMAGNSFDPAAAGIGTHTITYSYTSAAGC